MKSNENNDVNENNLIMDNTELVNDQIISRVRKLL
jgi:hypothetical protein